MNKYELRAAKHLQSEITQAKQLGINTKTHQDILNRIRASSVTTGEAYHYAYLLRISIEAAETITR